jgi:xanthine dehydrogenase accessory factor
VTSRADVLIEAGRRSAAGRPYVLATVVTVLRPASARRGDRALVGEDGELIGWVGGSCSEPVVVREALRAIADGRPRLRRIGPAGEPPAPAAGDDAAVVIESSCASEGTVEVLIEPELPQPLLAVVGASPVARSLVALAETIGWRAAGEPAEDADAVVVATMGHGDEDALAAALAGRAGYVGLVASARRAGTVLAALRERGVDEEALARVRSPAGLDLGPSTQEEIAVAIVAELVAWRHGRGEAPDHVPEAVDPVCGMTVAIGPTTETAVHAGVAYHFCCPGCRSRFEADPTRYAPVADA